ncbi:prefoldin subunit 2 isoform X2 [Perognathus longimembris pacificus]|uniref:prefoldin subunit 2 isoform X2 n=1 Tax=Perognathus longimembris pacificus TaxID=214514 RepID=UPI002019D177|nr:prefoldin subunit 2 isoform X2 [Perognathus longimembris pacificus]
MADGSGRLGKSGGSGAGKGAVSAEQVIAGFNRLRQEQRGLASKAAELEMELNEHSLVIDTLKEVDETRKCFRMVGGVLVERTVKEVLPALENNKEQASPGEARVQTLVPPPNSSLPSRYRRSLRHCHSNFRQREKN